MIREQKEQEVIDKQQEEIRKQKEKKQESIRLKIFEEESLITENNREASHEQIHLNNLSRITTRNVDEERETEIGKEESESDENGQESEDKDSFYADGGHSQNEDNKISHSQNEGDFQESQNSERIDPKSIYDIDEVKQEDKRVERTRKKDQ